jgi:hypothetical protein
VLNTRINLTKDQFRNQWLTNLEKELLDSPLPPSHQTAMLEEAKRPSNGRYSILYNDKI